MDYTVTQPRKLSHALGNTSHTKNQIQAKEGTKEQTKNKVGTCEWVAEGKRQYV